MGIAPTAAVTLRAASVGVWAMNDETPPRGGAAGAGCRCGFPYRGRHQEHVVEVSPPTPAALAPTTCRRTHISVPDVQVDAARAAQDPKYREWLRRRELLCGPRKTTSPPNGSRNGRCPNRRCAKRKIGFWTPGEISPPAGQGGPESRLPLWEWSLGRASRPWSGAENNTGRPLGGSGRCRHWWSVSLDPVSMAPI